jgi:hypothetical protein
MKDVNGRKSTNNSYGHEPVIIKKSPINMNYKELETLLDLLLARENFPSDITYRSDSIHYQRRSMVPIIAKALYRLIRAEIVYQTYLRKRIKQLKESKEIYKALKKTGCLKAIRMYLYLAKIGLNDLLNHLGGRFNDKLFADFTFATQLYDASFDVPECRKYLKDFETFVMTGKYIESNDVVLRIFNECMDNLKQTISKQEFDTFLKLVQIEHISQLMSIYQLSDKNLNPDNLRKITFSKGGIALLAILYIMAPKMKEQEKKTIYELGSVMQIIDDIRDTKEDLQGGIQTLPNQKVLDSHELKSMFACAVNNLIEQCNINPNQPNGTLDMLCWFSDTLLEGRYGKYLQKSKS